MDHEEICYRRYLNGEQDAFDEIVKTYRLGLIFFINRFVRDVHTAEDIAIDVFVELLTHPKRYNFKTSLKTYLFMLGRSRALDHLRRRNFLSLYELPEDLKDETSLEELLLKSDRKKALNEALRQLPRDMQQAVHLVYFEEFSYQEAAAVMKKTAKQVDNLLYRAKASLRETLGKEWKEL